MTTTTGPLETVIILGLVVLIFWPYRPRNPR